MEGAKKELNPCCVASTAPTLEIKPCILRSATWSADGTCVVTNSDDKALRTYVLPQHLLTSQSLLTLEPYYTIRNPEPVLSTALYPHYNLSDDHTTLILSSVDEHPIRLFNTLHPGLHASYALVNPNTEEFITPHSLHFTADGSHFIAGSDSLFTIFDINNPGLGPIESHPTIPSKRKKIIGGGVGIKGIVSALATSCDGLLAIGTFTRCIGLYSNQGRGECVSVFSLAGEEGEIGGGGVTQTLWSPCGRYLYIAERKSDGIIAYDVRVAGKKLGVLRGRKAVTNQRMNVDLVPTAAGHEIWAGGTDGTVRVWESPHRFEGTLDASMSWDAHSDAVSTVGVHQSGSVVVTCSGQRHDEDETDASSDEGTSDYSSDSGDGFDASEELVASAVGDFSMKIWSL